MAGKAVEVGKDFVAELLKRTKLSDEAKNALLSDESVLEFAGESALLRSDYSRKTAEVANVRKQALGVIQQRQQEMEQLDDPRFFRSWVEQNGKGDAFFAAAQELAAEVKAYKAMSPEQQQAYDHERRVREREANVERREREAAENTQQHEFAQHRQKHATDLAAMVPNAFARFQIQDSKLSQQLFGQHLKAMIDGMDRFDGLSQQLVDDAAQATLETLRDLGRYREPAPTTQARGAAAPPPTALPGARPPGSPRVEQVTRGRIGDLSPLYKRR